MKWFFVGKRKKQKEKKCKATEINNSDAAVNWIDVREMEKEDDHN